MSLQNKKVIECLKYFGAKQSCEMEESATIYSNVSIKMDNWQLVTF